MDASYIPEGAGDPPWLGDSWFSYSLDTKLGQKVEEIVEDGIGSPSPSYSTSDSSETLESWVYFMLTVPPTMSGSTLTVDVMASTVVDIFGRFRGLPTSLQFDMSSNSSRGGVARQGYSPLQENFTSFEIGGEGKATLEIIYPQEGIWFFGMRVLSEINNAGTFRGRETIIKGTDQELKLRFLSHGCPKDCSWHGGCHLMMDESHIQQIR